MLTFPGKDRIRRGLATTYCRNARCLFVLSTGRAGTTTLTHLLGLSNRIRSQHEPHPVMLAETHDAYQGSPGNQAQMLQYCETWAVTRFRWLLWTGSGGKLYAETSNRLTYLAPGLADYFPNARFLFLHRHPGDVVRSAMRRGYYRAPNHEWDEHRIRPRPHDPASQEWESWSAFEKCCWYWHAVNAFASEFMAQLPATRGLSMAAETLFRDLDAIGNIFEWMNVPSPDRKAVANALRTPDNAQAEGEFPKYADWSASQKGDLIRIAGRTARELGYQLNAASEPSDSNAKKS